MAVGQVEYAARQKWALTREAFDGLLASLGPNRDAAAERYLEIRRNLVRLFAWRGCPMPDEYADETINRCAKKIGEGEEIRDVATYCVGIARMMLREMTRDAVKHEVPLDAVPERRTLPDAREDDSEHRVECLRRCLDELPPESRNLILNYYHGEKSGKIQNRKDLMALFGVPASTLRMRALRLRERLQLCSEDCLEGRLGDRLRNPGSHA